MGNLLSLSLIHPDDPSPIPNPQFPITNPQSSTMSSPPEKLVAEEGALESERQKRLKLISDLKQSLLQRAPDFGFDPTILFSLIDHFLLCPDLDTLNLNKVKQKLDTFIQCLINIFDTLAPLPSMMNTEKPMRLLISNCREICVVDIKDNSRNGVEYLDKIATSDCLFKLGSDVYMIGGKKLPFEYKIISCSNNDDSDDDDDDDLLHSKCHWLKLNSFTSTFGFRIKSHLVVGDHIFAIDSKSNKHLLFDSTNSKWKVQDETSGASSPTSPLYIKTVWDILSYGGKAICVDQIEFQNDSYYVVLALLTEASRTFEKYDADDDDDDDDGGYIIEVHRDSVYVVAYVVESSGKIVGRQTLYDFFNGPVQPSSVWTSAIMKGGGKDGKTMCVALTGQAITGDTNDTKYLTDDTKKTDAHFFFVSNSFTVEVAMVNNLKLNMKRILKAGCKHGIAMDQELVRIHIKDRCVYQLLGNDVKSFDASTEVCFF